MLALGAAFVAPPTSMNLTCHVPVTLPEFLHSLAKYPFECDFYNQNMMHLTGNPSKEMIKAILMTLIHTKT